MKLWTVDLRLGAAVEEDEWVCFQSRLGPHGSAPILGYGDHLAARTVQLRRIEAPSEDDAGRLALEIVRSAAEACEVVIDPTVTRVAPSA
jgi:hypothetical protein